MDSHPHGLPRGSPRASLAPMLPMARRPPILMMPRGRSGRRTMTARFGFLGTGRRRANGATMTPRRPPALTQRGAGQGPPRLVHRGTATPIPSPPVGHHHHRVGGRGRRARNAPGGIGRRRREHGLAAAVAMTVTLDHPRGRVRDGKEEKKMGVGHHHGEVGHL